VLFLPAGDPRELVGEAVERIRDWVRDDDGRLVFVTRTGDVAGAGVGGLVRVAQQEYPGRFGLVETDDPAASVDAALASGEPQVRVRGGVVEVPRLVRAGWVCRLGLVLMTRC
jgi:hypothetical protein